MRTFGDASEEMIQRTRHQPGHGVRLPSPGGSVSEHGTSKALESAAYQGGAHRVVYVLLNVQ